jgi:hypothetical protein
MEYELRISNNDDFLESDFTDAKLLSIPSVNFKSCRDNRMYQSRNRCNRGLYVNVIWAKDEAGNIGSVSYIISIFAVNGFKIAVTDCRDITKRDDEVKEKKEKPNSLVMCLSSAAAVIVLTIVILTLTLKNAKAKARVEGKKCFQLYYWYIAINVNIPNSNHKNDKFKIELFLMLSYFLSQLKKY